MYTTLVTFRQFNISPSAQKAHQSSQCEMVKSFCNTFVLPDDTCNHSRFDENLASKIASYKDRALKPVTDMLSCADNEKDITAGLFLLNRIIDAGAQSAYKTYPVISKFNYSSSSNVQTMLAGVYRKTLVPDAFGPLMTMFLKNSQNPKTFPFDPNEEIGGAILEYLRNKSAVINYSKN